MAGERVSAASVDYMELPGARKDADCNHVAVKDGVSSQLGCCNDFRFEAGNVRQFRCGTCVHLVQIRNGKEKNFYGG